MATFLLQKKQRRFTLTQIFEFLQRNFLRPMQISYDNGKYICSCSFEERMLAKAKGFFWDEKLKHWYTEDVRVAARLREFCDESVKPKLIPLFLKITPWTGGLPHPQNLTLKEYQKTAAGFSLSRNHSYLGLDPGLGKGVIAAVLHNALGGHLVFICPTFLMRNVEYEFLKWSSLQKVFISRLSTPPPKEAKSSVWIIPDSMVIKPQTQKRLKEFVERTNADYGKKPFLIVDEAHRYKNMDSQRTHALFMAIKPLFNRTVLMSGTPMPSRPIELFPVLTRCAPETIDFMTLNEFSNRYCGGADPNKYGQRDRGATNVKELSERIAKYMLRIRKDEVLTELPPKTEEMVFISDDLPTEIAELDRLLLRKIDPKNLVGLDDEGQAGLKQLPLSTYRREIGKRKALLAAPYIRNLLTDSEQVAIIVFAIHKEVVRYLAKELEDFLPIVVNGDTPVDTRQDLVKTFQTDKTRRLVIGNIQALGVGFTMTKATRVIFTEFSWVPGENDQASDRAHRIGQRDNVFCQYLVYRNSLDRMVLETIFKKKEALAYI
jgi:SWI/SNF-related matrix-associated actin-dependent regulator 1 of chromatin subfamily A